MKRYLVVPSRCTACRTCELACSFRHGVGGLPGPSRIRAYLFGDGKNVPLTCMQCDTAACVQVCPVDALVRSATTGAIEVHETRCVSCKACVAACPFGAMAMGPKQTHPHKCDLCGGEPACVAFCPTKALEYVGA